MGVRVILVAAAAAVVTLSSLVAPARAAAPDDPVSVSPPRIVGEAVYDGRLRSGPGVWDPSNVTVTYQWLRGSRPIAGATTAAYRPVLDDLFHALRSRVTATDDQGRTATAVSEPTGPVQRALFRQRARPRVEGVTRWTHDLSATPGRWGPAPQRTTYQWLRDGTPVDGADRRRYTPAPGDVGHRLSVRVEVSAPGYRSARARSTAVRERHRVGVRRTVSYHIETRGRITTSLKKFARLAQESYDDARGWRGAGVEFQRVDHGGGFTLVLAEASEVPKFSSGCSAEYSCRVGRYVIINQTRWLEATPPWRAAGGSLRDYRHLVVNHETGHWLGLGHAGCSGPGRPAPVMMQQSKGLDGCRFNPWPIVREWHAVGGRASARAAVRRSFPVVLPGI